MERTETGVPPAVVNRFGVPRAQSKALLQRDPYISEQHRRTSACNASSFGFHPSIFRMDISKSYSLERRSQFTSLSTKNTATQIHAAGRRRPLCRDTKQPREAYTLPQTADMLRTPAYRVEQGNVKP